MLQWKEDLSVGVDFIDKEHKEIINRLNDFMKAGQSGRAKEEVLNAIEFLAGYTSSHFTNEENYMKKINYPDYKQHAEIHNNFLNRVSELKKQIEIEGAKLNLIIQVNKVVTDLLINHINKVDKSLAKYAKENC